MKKGIKGSFKVQLKEKICNGLPHIDQEFLVATVISFQVESQTSKGLLTKSALKTPSVRNLPGFICILNNALREEYNNE